MRIVFVVLLYSALFLSDIYQHIYSAALLAVFSVLTRNVDYKSEKPILQYIIILLSFLSFLMFVSNIQPYPIGNVKHSIKLIVHIIEIIVVSRILWGITEKELNLAFTYVIVIQILLVTIQVFYVGPLYYIEKFGIQRLNGFLYNSNTLGWLLGSLLLYKLCTVKYSARNIFLVFACFLAIVFTASRASIFSFAVVGTIVVFIRSKSLWLLLLILLISLGSLSFLIYEYPELLRLESSLSGRDFLWNSALQVFHKYPIVGAGYDSFDLMYVRDVGVDLAQFLNLQGGKFHSLYLSLLAELGIIGLILVMSLFILLLYYSIVLYKVSYEKIYLGLFSIIIFHMLRGIFEVGNVIPDLSIAETVFVVVTVSVLNSGMRVKSRNGF